MAANTQQDTMTNFVPPYECESGIRWNRVAPGFTMLRSADYETHQPNSDPSLVRSLFITGILFNLEALPTDLSDNEVTLIRAKLPPKLSPESRSKCSCSNSNSNPKPNPYSNSNSSAPLQEAVRFCLRDDRGYDYNSWIWRHEQESGRGDEVDSQNDDDGVPPLIHRFTASCIIHSCLMIQFLLPYIITIFQRLRRSKQVREVVKCAIKLGGRGVRIMQGTGILVGSKIINVSEGAMRGRLLRLLGIVVWWISAVLGGTIEGFAEGFGILAGG